jgi:nucleoid-associated protein YgaU
MPENILPESGSIDLKNNEEQPVENNVNDIVETPNTAAEPLEIQTLPEQQLQPVEPTQTEVITTNNSPEPIEEPAEPEPDSSSDGGNSSGIKPIDESGKISSKAIATAAIIAGVIVIFSGIVLYRYFNSEPSTETASTPTPSVQVTNDDNNNANDEYEGIVSDLNGRITSGVSTSRADEWELPGDSTGIVMSNSASVPVTNSNAHPSTSEGNAANNGSSGTSNNVQEDSTNIASGANAATDTNTNVTTQPTQQQNNAAQVSQVSNSSDSAWHANDYSPGQIKPGSYTVVSGDTLYEIAEAAYGNGADWHKIATANNVSYLANGNPLIIPGQVLNIPT